MYIYVIYVIYNIYIYIYIYILYIIYIYVYIHTSKCKTDYFHIKTKCLLTVQGLGFLRLDNRLAAG